MRGDKGGLAENPEPRWAGAPEEFPPGYEEFARRRKRYLDRRRARAGSTTCANGGLRRERRFPGPPASPADETSLGASA